MAPQSSPANNPSPAEYSNPPVADGINNPPESQLKSFFVNAGLVGLALAGLYVLLNLAATYLTPFIPFAWERKVVGREFLQSDLDAVGRAKQEELRRLASRLATALEMPKGMDVAVFYNPGRVVNAFATFGGNILVFQGLLDLMESEDELAMVLAHEMAHVRHRDPVKGVVRAFGLMLLSAGIETGGDAIAQLGMASYSRGQEEDADRAAVAALGRVYGHTGGATAFFRTMARKVEKRGPDAKVSSLPALTASHPDTLLRLRRAGEEAARLGIPADGEMTPLAEGLAGSGAELRNTCLLSHELKIHNSQCTIMNHNAQ